MLPFFAGGNPFAASPEMALMQKIGQDGAPAAPQVPDPATTGAIPPQAPTQAPPAAPAAPSGGGLGDLLANAISGRGIFGGQAGDDTPDPNTGITPGDRRASAMQALLKMGLLFIAAGQNISNDSRAAILAKASGIFGGDDMNSFAKSRLEMAKLKLEQRKQLAEEQSTQAITQALGGGLGGGAAAPSAGAGAVQTAQAGNEATGAAIGAPATAATAPGGVPRGGLTFSDADRLRVLAQPSPAGKASEMAKVLSERQNAEQEGAPYFDRQTQTMKIPVFRNGQRVATKDGGRLPEETRDVGGFREKGYALPDGTWHVTGRQEIAEDPTNVENRRARLGIAQKDRDTYQGTYQDSVQTAVKSYDKMREIREQVIAGQGVFGTGSNYLVGVMNALATAGYLDKDKIGDLNVRSNFERVMKNGVAGVIKDFNGSQGVSNADRDFAAQVMGAAATNNREAIINSLNNGMNDQRGIISKYNENAGRHNARADKFDKDTAEFLRVPTVERDFDKEERDLSDKRKPAGASAGGPAAESGSGGGVRRVERDPKTGKLRFVQ